MDCKPNYYNIILKKCSRRENLCRRLEKVLLRGSAAIKLALDNIPSVIIYKGNTNNILTVLKTFKDEYAAITVLPEHLPPVLPLYRLYRNFDKLSLDLQVLLINVPSNLWLGETIYHIAPGSFAGENGAIVITSHAIYFIDKPTGDKVSRWLAIPFYYVIDFPSRTTSSETYLIVTYQDINGFQNAVFTIDKEFFNSIMVAIEQAKAAGQYLTKIKTSCTACNYISEDFIDNAPVEDRCHCGGQYHRTLIAY